MFFVLSLLVLVGLAVRRRLVVWRLTRVWLRFLTGFGSWWSEGAEVEDDLPALQFGQTAEGGHAAIRVAIRDFPKKSAIRLLLNGGKVKISGLL